MPNNGYISSSGISQVFTTGPYIGAVVTSSYSSGSTLLGPTVNFSQYFISGTIDTIDVCNNIFQRYYYDPYECPTGACLPPIAISATVANCANFNYLYFFFFNSGSTAADYSTIEYSTSPNFSFNTGSIFVTNSVGYTNPINVSNLGSLPISTTPVYFRVFNSCSISGLSSYSNTVSASCQLIPPPVITPFTVRLKNSMTGDDNNLYYTYNDIEYVLFGGTTINLSITTLGSLNIPFRTLRPDDEVHTLVISGSTTAFNGYVFTQLNDDTLTYQSTNVYQSANNYIAYLYYNPQGEPDASVTVDRTLWSGDGILEIDFTMLTPSDEQNPWYFPPIEEETGGGGCHSWPYTNC